VKIDSGISPEKEPEMGIMDQFKKEEVETKPTVTVSFDPTDAVRVNDACAAMKSHGCKSRGDFCRQAILQAVEEVERGFGGAAKVIEAANKADPEGKRHERKTRDSKAQPQNSTTTLPETPKAKQKAASAR
jgi:hypothetical protein